MVAVLYANDKQTEEEIREITLFTISTNSVNCLCVNLTNHVKDLYNKDFKSLKKEIEDIRRWKYLPAHRLVGLT